MSNDTIHNSERPEKNGFDLTESEFNERMDAFHSGKPTPVLVRADDPSERREPSVDLEALKALDELDDLIPESEGGTAPTADPVPVEVSEVAADDDDTYEVIRDTPKSSTPYGRAFTRLRELEALRDKATPGSDEYHALSGPLAEAKRRFKIEGKRALDDEWRNRRGTDEWRTGEGKPTYNASRRKVRDIPNQMTPKEVLAAMSPEEREQHDKDKNALRVWRHAKRKAGWSDDRIEAELPSWWARRRAKRGKSL